MKTINTYTSTALFALVLCGGCDALDTDEDTDSDTGPVPRDVSTTPRDVASADVEDDASDVAGDAPESDTSEDTDSDAGEDVATDAASPDVEADTPADTEDATPDAAEYGGPPTITRLFPEIVLSDGLFYVEGEHLAALPNDVTNTDVTIVTEDADLDAVIITTNVITGVPGRIVVAAPRDLHERLLGRGTVVVTTPEGEAEYSSVYATNDSTFSGKTEPGAGLVGNVYRLVAETGSLPNLDDACADPSVLNTEEWPCPFTSIMLENVNIPARSWEAGFPGLLADVDEWFALRLQGYVEIEVAGSYAFRICSDDGSRLWIGEGDERLDIVNNDGLHSMQCRDGRTDMTAGRHAITLDYFQGPRTEIGLVLDWQPPGGEWEPIPPEAMRLFELDEF